MAEAGGALAGAELVLRRARREEAAAALPGRVILDPLTGQRLATSRGSPPRDEVVFAAALEQGESRVGVQPRITVSIRPQERGSHSRTAGVDAWRAELDQRHEVGTRPRSAARRRRSAPPRRSLVAAAAAVTSTMCRLPAVHGRVRLRREHADDRGPSCNSAGRRLSSSARRNDQLDPQRELEAIS